MKNSRTIYVCALMISVIASLGLAAVRVLALLVEFDADALYYNYGADFPKAFTWGAVIAVMIAFLFTLLLRSDMRRIGIETDSAALTFTSAVVGFIILGGTIYNVTFGSALAGSSGMAGTLGTVSLVLSIPAAIFFLAAIALPVRSRNAQVILSVFMILWMFTEIIKEYFSGGVEINNPNRSLYLTALSVTLIFFVAEGRFRVGPSRRQLYIFSGLSALITLGLYSLPNSVLIALRAYPENVDIVRELTVLSIFFYILVRMCVLSGCFGYDDIDDEPLDDTENIGTSDEEHIADAAAAAEQSEKTDVPAEEISADTAHTKEIGDAAEAAPGASAAKTAIRRRATRAVPDRGRRGGVTENKTDAESV